VRQGEVGYLLLLGKAGGEGEKYVKILIEYPSELIHVLGQLRF
jgi:hypothetical protein